MNLRDPQYLVAVAEHRHFGRAADACFVSQPTLSTQIKKLEERLGITLMPALAATGGDSVSYIPFRGEAPHRDIGLCWRVSSPRRALFDALSECVVGTLN